FDRAVLVREAFGVRRIPPLSEAARVPRRWTYARMSAVVFAHALCSKVEMAFGPAAALRAVPSRGGPGAAVRPKDRSDQDRTSGSGIRQRRADPGPYPRQGGRSVFAARGGRRRAKSVRDRFFL